MHRFQISTFGAIAIVFAVSGVNQGIFSNSPSLNAMSTGWLITAIVDILWVLYFTSEEDSLALHLFNSMGTGGLTPPGRRRRTRTQSSVHNMSSTNNGYASNYSSGGGIGNIPYESKGMGGGGALGSGGIGGGAKSQNSFNAGSVDGGVGNRSLGAASIHNSPSAGGGGSIGGGDNGPSSPLMAGIGAGSGPASATATDPNMMGEAHPYKAKALYACTFSYFDDSTSSPHTIPLDTASPDDPTEISFAKNEILDIVDKQGKWWQARKVDGTIGSA